MYRYDDDDEPYDYGFEQPDTRWTAILDDETEVNVIIQRDRRYNSELERNEWAMWYVIVTDGHTTKLPENVDESQAIEIARIMYRDRIDGDATEDARATKRAYAMERKYGF
ncbi:hypothetical protein [Cohnella silvisoli]|uniref:Uncharacterized protein n=1 Tax=Cohnella silvisoli TaxID=2873699 RepID=A0ABV1KYU0_9BACL|nr:hypothetical protein [Cohnella silvisoli]MCD9024334.1 hypothetical protein [Cohnella silvisoli]